MRLNILVGLSLLAVNFSSVAQAQCAKCVRQRAALGNVYQCVGIGHGQHPNGFYIYCKTTPLK